MFREVPQFLLESPLNELARSNPSDVMSRYSMSAKNFGSTQVALGLRTGLVSFDFGLVTVSRFFRIWLDTVRDQPCKGRYLASQLDTEAARAFEVLTRHSFWADHLKTGISLQRLNTLLPRYVCLTVHRQ
jgi:hypothetical protein